MAETLYNNTTVPEATEIQKALRAQLVLQKSPGFKVQTIAGADISFNLYETTVYAGIIVLSFPALVPIGYSLVKTEVLFPYVPGYLAFREAPSLLQAWQALPHKPDVMVVDGHGIAHPRRLGIAAHFGVLTKQVSIGCAKTILFGKFTEPPAAKGNYSFIKDKDEVIGAALRTKEKVKPVFISPGYGLNLEDSIDIIQQCTGKYRLPEPTRKAHEMVNNFRKGLLPEGYTSL